MTVHPRTLLGQFRTVLPNTVRTTLEGLVSRVREAV